MNFQEINTKLSEAQELYKQAVEGEKVAITKKKDLDILLLTAEADFKVARLERGLRDKEVNTLQEQSRNLRKEASI